MIGQRIPWCVLVWARRRFGLCWSSVMDLKLYGIRAFRADGKTLRPTPGCFAAHPDPYDYCGAYGPEHPCFQAVLRARQRAGEPG